MTRSRTLRCGVCKEPYQLVRMLWEPSCGHHLKHAEDREVAERGTARRIPVEDTP